jgi:predicted nucleic acid-binding protein
MIARHPFALTPRLALVLESAAVSSDAFMDGGLTLVTNNTQEFERVPGLVD